MKKKVIFSVLIALLIGLSYGIYYLKNALPIATGYSAKILCSCVFLSERNENSCLEQDLSKFGIVTTQVDYEEKTVSATVHGFAERTAIYREGLGCTLIIEDEKKLAQPKLTPNFKFQTSSDTIPWPMGDKTEQKPLPPEIDKAKLNAVLDNAFSEPLPDAKRYTRAIIVVYKNQIIAERYADGINENTCLTGWSMAKSVTGTLIGLLAKRGKLDINDRAPIPKWANDSRKEITIDQLMRMSSGLQFEEVYGGVSDATNMLFNSYSAADFAIDKPLHTEIDGEWYYSSATTNILGKLVGETVKKDRKDYMNFPKEELFNKIGMHRAVMEVDASGNIVGSSFMYATARDWARFGLLYLHDGVWNRERILPKGWVEYVSTPTPKAPLGKYGAQFWLNAGEQGNENNRPWPHLPNDIFYCSGYEGQNVIIIPSYDMVIVRLGLAENREVYKKEELIEGVLGAVKPS
ncbi:MAG: serine hydrolase [Flavobacteriales bacterium]|nr:MAG: serine hydrolase [Flavobacteriales bacterium]